MAIISRTYCSDNEIDNPPDGLLCIRLPNYIMGKDDLGVAIATVITNQSEAANDYLNFCRDLPVNVFAFSIPLNLQYVYKMLIGSDSLASSEAIVKLVQIEDKYVKHYFSLLAEVGGM